MQNAVQATSQDEHPRAYPIAEGFTRLGIKPTKGGELVKNAMDPEQRAKGNYLDTFCNGRFRYVTAQELRRFIEARIAEAQKESASDRAKKVEKAVAGQHRQA